MEWLNLKRFFSIGIISYEHILLVALYYVNHSLVVYPLSSTTKYALDHACHILEAVKFRKTVDSRKVDQKVNRNLDL